MKILFLGTGAADYKAEHREMEGYRRNSSALIDDILLIDPGPSVPDAIETFGVDVSRIKYVLNTHRHRDHFNQGTLEMLEANGATLIQLADDEVREIDGYTITALKGNHPVKTQHFIIEREGKRIFYGLDSAWLFRPEVHAIKEKGVDFAVFDGTIGFVERDGRIFEHCSMPMIIMMMAYLGKYVGRPCVSHMARTLHTDHQTLAAEMAKHGIEVAYDGWSTEI